MDRAKHDTIPLDDEAKIRALVEKYHLLPISPQPPKPRPGSLPMNARTEWDEPCAPDEFLISVAPFATRYWTRYVPNWDFRWVWYRGSAVTLRADTDYGQQLHRMITRWVPTELKMMELATEFDRRGCTSLWDIPNLADELCPFDPNKPPRQSKPKDPFSKLKKARKDVEEATTGVRNDGFEAWIRRYVAPAERPSEWTQATILYENYIKHARGWGNNRPDKRLSQLALATETRFGIMLREIGLIKKRKHGGFFYPLRIKAGA